MTAEEQPDSPEALQAAEEERLLRLRRAGLEQLQEVHGRISEARRHLEQAVDQTPVGAVHAEIQRVLQEMLRAKTEFEKKRAVFHERYLKVSPEGSEFRGHLALLELQYEDRVRIAETGLQLLLDSISTHYRLSRGRIEDFCVRAAESLGTRVYPVHADFREVVQRDARTYEGFKSALAALRADKDAVLEHHRRETVQVQELARYTSRMFSTERDKAARELQERERSEQSLRAHVEKLESWLKAAEDERAQALERSKGLQTECGRLREQTVFQEKHLQDLLKAAQRPARGTDLEGASSRTADELARLQGEEKTFEAERAALRAALEKSEADLRRAQEQRDEAKRTAPEAALLPRMELLERRLHEAEAARDLATQKVQELSRTLSSSEHERGEKLAECAGSWAAEKARLLEQVGEQDALLWGLREKLARETQEWEKTMVAQDKLRLEEIFRLRAQVQQSTAPGKGGPNP
ncbi:MAG: hypothetical protein WC969_01250 [Elusimicrobiota bacterium]|jgi:hypothetical protein